MVECQSCGGQFDPVLADGSLYFHVCPPLSLAEIRAGLAAGTLMLRGDMVARYEAAQAADAKKPPAADAIGRVAAFLATLTIDRPNARNENIAQPATNTAAAVIKAEGAGVLEVVAVDDGPIATFQAAPIAEPPIASPGV